MEGNNHLMASKGIGWKKARLGVAGMTALRDGASYVPYTDHSERLVLHLINIIPVIHLIRVVIKSN